MTVFGKSVPALSIESAFAQLCTFLNGFSNVVLVAHNGRRFDFPVIVNSAINCSQLESFLNNFVGMMDSLS